LRTHRLRHGLGAAHGIGHNRDDKGVVTLVLPDGVPAEALVAGDVDNYATHKHPRVRAWLERHKRFHFHFTPTSGPPGSMPSKASSPN
jgi:hypothetical protein